MPNWVYNTLTITGAEKDVSGLVTRLAGEKECLSFQRICPRPDSEEENWYAWNNEHWGTKWDACDPELEELSTPTGKEARYRFSTAWSPPLPVFEVLCLGHPDLEITMLFEEEQGWGGEVHGHNGDLKLLRQWDIPSSHQDHVERDSTCWCETIERDATHPVDQMYFSDCFAAVLARFEIELDADELHAATVLLREWEGTLDELAVAARALVRETSVAKP